MNLNRNATLAEVGEFPLIAAITQGLSLAPDVSVGPGDDAAVLVIKDAVATSVDVLVEGVHFRRDWSEARDVGRKAVAVNVADIEAIGARATGLLVGFSAPPDLSLGWVLDFADGLGEEAKAAGVSLLGGDVTRARDITIAITALGTLDGRRPVLRSGARPGDLVAIQGRLGWAAARPGRPRTGIPLTPGARRGPPRAPGQLRRRCGRCPGGSHIHDRHLRRPACRSRTCGTGVWCAHRVAAGCLRRR